MNVNPNTLKLQFHYTHVSDSFFFFFYGSFVFAVLLCVFVTSLVTHLFFLVCLLCYLCVGCFTLCVRWPCEPDPSTASCSPAPRPDNLSVYWTDPRQTHKRAQRSQVSNHNRNYHKIITVFIHFSPSHSQCPTSSAAETTSSLQWTQATDQRERQTGGDRIKFL